MRRLRTFWANDEALAITEYGILVAFVAFVFIAAILTFGTTMSTWFASKSNNITTN